MKEIKGVRVWKNTMKTEARVYVHTTDGREACFFSTGNAWHEKKSWESQLTEEEIQRARELACWGGRWHTVAETSMAARIATVDTPLPTVAPLTHPVVAVAPAPAPAPAVTPAVATTFDDFFAAPTDRGLCKCGKPHNRTEFLYSDDEGNQKWICAECAKERATAQQVKLQSARDMLRRLDNFERYCA